MCSLLCARSMFRPDFYWWRLVLTLRKLCEVIIALLLSSKPLFQAWCALDSPHSRLVLRRGAQWFVAPDSQVLSLSWLTEKQQLLELACPTCTDIYWLKD
jgi:hypothetical protein